ncbi:MAG: polysaccharide biosynthesis C-terminal domain-containing protein [Ekhidna sp.]|nr:polysaccharide biosynthesis C-terminal domain-containing protein [Ekhidna sp.]
MLSKKKITTALGGNIIETVLGFIVIMFVTRNYSQADTGVYFIVLAIVSILNNLKEGFLQNGFVKYLVEFDFDRGVLRTGFTVSLLCETVKILLFLLIAFIYSPVQSFILFYGLYTITFSTYRLLIFIHKSKLDMKQIVFGNFIILFATITGLAILYLFRFSVEWVFLIIGSANLMALLFIRSNRQLMAANLFRGYDKSILKNMVHFGKYGLLREMAGSVAHQAGIFISAYLLTLEATSILGLATRYTILISIPGASLAGMLYPTILKEVPNRDRLVEVARAGIGKMYALLIPVALIIIIGSPFAIYILHGVSYLPAAVILAFKMLSSVFLIPLGSGFSSLMNAINRPQETTKLMVISSVSNIILSVSLLFYFGLWGAAVAPLITEIIGSCIIRTKLKKQLNFEVFNIVSSIKNYWFYWITKILPWKILRYQS